MSTNTSSLGSKQQAISESTLDDLKEAANKIVPLIKQHRATGNQQRDLAPEVMQAIIDAGLFRLYQPKAWGGSELDPRAFWSVQAIFAEHCLSTGWVHGVLSVQSFVMAQFGQQAQADVWAQDPDVLVSSSFQPTGKVSEVEGGYRLTGHWTFSSGSSFAKWVLVGALVYPNGEKKPPQMALFLVPRGDYQIKDTWHTFGLRATGSNDVVIEDAFVPQHRMLLPAAGIVPEVADSADAPALYQLPWLYIFTGGISYLGIGACRGALNNFITVAKTRRAIITGKAVKEDPDVNRIIAKTQAALASATAIYEQHIANMFTAIEQQQRMPFSEGLLQRSQMMGVMRNLTACVDAMRLLLGGRGVREDSPLTQCWLDMNAACAHPGNDPRAIELLFGQSQLTED
jgi:3-hydroxy-9,10-secoandrosta-1,3,5(10)-triene-9,17-dione monooxygenase